MKCSSLCALLVACVPTIASAHCQTEPVYMLWATDCGVCESVAKYLDKNFVYVDWLHSKKLRSYRDAPAYGYPGTPMLTVEGESVEGFDRPKIDRLLCLRN